jgi:hypothetical protein
MSVGKIILLNILILVLGLVAYSIYNQSTTPPPADPAEVAPAASGDEVIIFDDEGGAEEATDLLGTKLVLFMVGGISLGVLLVMYVVPAIANSAGNFFYSAPEKADSNLGAAAVSKLAQGDFEGAIDEYKKLIEDTPTDRFPVVEVSKIYVDRMGDIDGGIAFLEDSLNEKEWPIDDAAFLMFRIVDIEMTHRQDLPRAQELLTIITTEFADTRHAANAQHKLNEISRSSEPEPEPEPGTAPGTEGPGPGEGGPDETTEGPDSFDRLPPRS